MLAIILGLIFTGAGLFGIIVWHQDLLIIIKGLFPVLILVGGILAIVAGATSIKDAIDEKSNIIKENEEKK